MPRSLPALIALAALTATAMADPWPGWRGPGGQGHTAERNLPLRWGPKQNVRWKLQLPDSGNSTPVVWGDRVFVTQAGDKDWPPKGGNGGVAAARRRSLLCVDRHTGKLLWQRDVRYDEPEPTHPTNPYCAASPATDGEVVVVSHGSAGMYAYDLSGKELWKKDVGKLEHVWGNASSPVLHGDLAILWCGPGPRQFLLAVEKRTGKEVWRHDEPGGSSGLGQDRTWIGSWSTPIVARVGGADQLILSVPEKVKGFDPKTGKELWFCSGLGKLVYTSPLYHDGIVVAMSGFHGPALAVRPGGKGDITADRLWHHPTRNPQRIGTGVIVGEHLYMLEETGVPRCFELKTGKELWGTHVKNRPGSNCWSSMVAAGDRLYVTCRNGDTHILAARPTYEHLAVNRLNEHTDASIAVSGGALFVRTYKHLWCIASDEK